VDEQLKIYLRNNWKYWYFPSQSTSSGSLWEWLRFGIWELCVLINCVKLLAYRYLELVKMLTGRLIILRPCVSD